MQRFKKGFTLVELSLSLAFIGILSITIVLIINNAIATYRRGLTLNQINTVGMDLMDDIRTVVQNSPARLLKYSCGIYESGKGKEDCESNGGKNLMIVRKTGTVNGKDDVPLFGAFCTGKYSYVWNSGYLFDNDAEVSSGTKASLKYESGSPLPSDFRLAKVEDTKRSVCASALSEYKTDDIQDELKVSDGAGIEILLAGNGDTGNALALYDFNAGMPAVNDDESAAFYSLSFILGTVQGGIDVKASGNFCKAPKEDGSNGFFNYCSINKFNFAVQANGG